MTSSKPWRYALIVVALPLVVGSPERAWGDIQSLQAVPPVAAAPPLGGALRSTSPLAEVPPPAERPAAPCSGASRSECRVDTSLCRIVLSNGSTLIGRMLDLRPGESRTLRLSDGTVRELPWTACAEAIEPVIERNRTAQGAPLATPAVSPGPGPVTEGDRKAQAAAEWAKQVRTAKAEAYDSRTRGILISGAVLLSVGLAVSAVGIWYISEANKPSNSINDAGGGVGGIIIGVPGGIPLIIATVLLPIGIYRSTR